MTYEATGKLHQPLTTDPPDQDWPYRAPRGAPIALYFAGMVVPDRPDLATGYTLFAPPAGLTVLDTILVPSAWAAAGAAALTLGSSSVPAAAVDGRNLVGLTDGWRSNGVYRIGPDDPLVATITGSPSAGNLTVYLLAAATSEIIGATWTDDSQTYRLS